jgi:hypothetical protein
MIQIVILGLMAVLAIVIAVLTGTLGKIWLMLFKQELNLPFGKKQNDSPPPTKQ